MQVIIVQRHRGLGGVSRFFIAVSIIGVAGTFQPCIAGSLATIGLFLVAFVVMAPDTSVKIIGWLGSQIWRIGRLFGGRKIA